MGSITTRVLTGLLVCACTLLGACVNHASKAPKESAIFTFVTLTSGPSSGSGTSEERQKMFQGHMANINRLAESGDLLMAGPFSKPADPSWRGLFVLDANLDRSAELVATDPGVMCGEFKPVLRPLSASTSLRQSLSLYRSLEAEQQSPRQKQSTPPALMRGYVIVIAANAKDARKAIDKAGLSVVFCGRFVDGDGNGGLFVLDSTDAAGVRNAIPALADSCTIDGWFSTASHVRLPDDARRQD